MHRDCSTDCRGAAEEGLSMLKYVFAAFVLVLILSTAVAERPKSTYIDYDSLPKFTDPDIPQVDWLWLLILVFVCLIALRLLSIMGGR